MKAVTREIVRHAHQLAHEVGAQAVLIYADAIAGDEELVQLLHTVDYRTILVSRSREPRPTLPWDDCVWATVPAVPMTRPGQVKMALLNCLAKGVLRPGDRVVCLSGPDGSGAIDTFSVLDLGTEPALFALVGGGALGGQVRFDVLERCLTLATQLAVEGREGRPVGLLFAVGDSDSVLAQSRGLVLNPFRGYAEAERNILDPALEETIKEFAALDGAFVIRGDGVVLSAGVQLLPQVPPAPLAKGLGTRHAAGAGITASTRGVAIVVSQSTGTVAVFQGGRLVTEIHRPLPGTGLAL
jgi:hypothetical protein